MHTPDYFVLRHNSAGWVECKTEDDLEKLLIKSPHRYVRDSDGSGCCRPGEVHASALGLDYRVLQFLDDYLRFGLGGTGDVDPVIKTTVEREAGILLLDLLVKFRAVVEPEVIYSLIASGEVYVNPSEAILAKPEHVRIFANAEVAVAYQEKYRELYEDVANCGRITGLPAAAA
jgi:putative transposase